LDDTLAVGLIRDLEAAKARLEGHERECNLRSELIQRDTKAINTAISAIASDVKALTERESTKDAQVNRRFLALAVGVITLLISALAWTAGQLYALEPVRVQAQKTAR
jgi:hypothetical protein